MATAANLALGPGAVVGRTGVSQRRIGIALPRIPVAQAGAILSRTAISIVDTDLVVDLGDSIGSGRWWRGVATLGALVGAAGALALQLPALTGSVPVSKLPALVEEGRVSAIGPLARASVTGRQAPPTPMARRLAEAPERPRIELRATIGSGGLEGALRRAGVGREDIGALNGLLAGVANSRGIRPGTSMDLVLGRRETKAVPRPLEFLSFRAAFDMKVEARRGADGTLVVKPVPIKIDNTPLRVTGVVGSSLDRSARAAGVPGHIISEYRRQMSYVLDFQREVQGRDKFEMVVARRRAETGETEMGGLLYAGLVNGRSNVSLMRWGKDGAFYWQNGESARKGLIRTPVSGARMSSGFGMRFHPILNYSRMHQGIDFAAPTGTPVVASAGGRVAQSGWGGGYGNIVVIDHGKGMKTRYAHLHRMNVKAGQQVSQGQVIGQVGSTGMSTGPHLHYEVWQNGRPVDPRSAKLSMGSQLGGSDLQTFKAEMGRLKGLPAAG